MSFSQDAKKVVNEPFVNIKGDCSTPEKLKLLEAVSQTLTASPLSKTSLRDVNNKKTQFMASMELRKNVLQIKNSPARTPKTRKKPETPNAPENSDPSPPKVPKTPIQPTNSLIVDGKMDFINLVNAADDVRALKSVGLILAKKILSGRPFQDFQSFTEAVGEKSARKIYINNL